MKMKLKHILLFYIKTACKMENEKNDINQKKDQFYRNTGKRFKSPVVINLIKSHQRKTLFVIINADLLD